MTTNLPRLEDLEAALGGLEGKRIFVRVDFNVPLEQTDDGSYRIVDDFRIRAALPTIEWLTERGAHVVAASHLGRPKGQPNPKYSLDPVRARLAELAPGVELLENLRFSPGEEANDPEFAASLVAGIDGYVNDAFGASHRAHASVVGPPRFVPSAMGRLLEQAVDVLLGLRNSPKRPFAPWRGQVSDKLGVIEHCRHRRLIVTAAMCFTFFAAGPFDRRLAVRARPGRDVCAARRRQGRHLPSDRRHRRRRGAHLGYQPARRCQGPRHRAGQRR